MDKRASSPIYLCPKCEGYMEKGRLMGLKFTSFAADSERNKISGKTIRVAAYRCQNCGYCEIYAGGSPQQDNNPLEEK
jgi:predicted nucleic-acid-binding Zn-ribbon protein